MVQQVGVGDAVDGGVHGNSEEEHGGYVAEAGGDAGDHGAGGHGLDKEKEGHDGEDVVVRGERHEPVYD